VPNAPLVGRAKWLLLVTLSVANLVATFSATAPIASILPVLTAALHTDVQTTTWTITVYQLASVGLVLTFGRLVDLRGLRRIYGVGCVVFVVGSLFCGIAQDIGQLIAARAFTGVGAAMLFAASPAVISRYSAARERGTMMGWLLTGSTFGIALGPLFAGYITDVFGWQWVFLSVVPVGLGVTALSLAAMPADPPARSGAFDVAGAVTFLAGVSLILLALNQGGVWGWGSPLTIGATASGLGILVVFAVIEYRHETPMLDLALFRRREFSAATLSATFSYVATGAVAVLIPIYLIQGRELSPTQAGAFLVTQPITRTVVGPVSGMLADRLGTWIPSAAGMAVYTVGLLFLAELGPTSPLAATVGGLVVVGIGAGLFLSPNTTAILAAAGRGQQGVASGMASTARSVGISVGVVLAAAALTTKTGGSATPAPALVYEGSATAFRIMAGCTLIATFAALVHERSDRPIPADGRRPYYVPADLSRDDPDGGEHGTT
jgi:EmrB/QacA subfamily drug resistance transporter